MQRARQRGEQLLRADDAIEVARHWPQAVVGRHRAVLEVFDLLQHGVRRARDEHVAGQEQYRQAVDMRQRGRGDEVGRAGPDRGRARHHPAPHVRLGVGDRGVRHALLVVRAEGGQVAPMLVQRLADAGDVAVTEDGEDAAEQGRRALGRLDTLRGETTHQRLRHGEPDGLAHSFTARNAHAFTPSRFCTLRASRQ